MPTPSALGRRRGTPARSQQMVLSPRALLVLAALCVSIFTMGIVLGTHLTGSPTDPSIPSSAGAGSPNGDPAAAGASAASAGGAVSVSDLVLKSAAVEALKKKNEAEAERAKAAAARLRGAAKKEAGDDFHTAYDEGGDKKGGAAKDAAREEVEHTDEEEEAQLRKQLDAHLEQMQKPNPLENWENSETGGETGEKANDKPEFPASYMGAPVPADHDFSSYQPLGGDRFQEWKDGETPYAITQSLRKQSDELARTRREHVRNAMKHAWKGYKEHAFGFDELMPKAKRGQNNWGGMGTTLVDSLDTLWLMGMKDEFWEARDWVRDKLDHDHVGSVSVFETTIRSLGGLLSAYDWSGDKAFLEKADDLGGRLFKAFDSPSGIPYGQVALNSGKKNNLGWAGGNAILAELGTMQVEFRYLARATGKTKYAEKAEHVYELMKPLQPADGLYPYYIRNKGPKPEFANDKISFGAMADSIYEYMLKIWLQGGRTESMYRYMYDKAMQGMHDVLLQKSTPSGLAYIADKNNGKIDHKMDHLVCFMGGNLALGAYTDPEGLGSPRAQRDLKTAKQLAYTCYQMYARMNTGISPEFVQFQEGSDFIIGRKAPFYILRPETVESFFILNRLTGDPIYREWGWEVFQSIERFCKQEAAYGSLHDVTKTDGQPENRMESFFLAETLKYLFLLQDPDTEVDILNKHVFNTEAHPLRTFEQFDKFSDAAGDASVQ